MYVCRLRLPDDFLVPLLRGALDHRRDQVRQNAGLAYLSYEYSDSAKKKKKDGEGGALTLRADLDAGKVSEDKLDREFTWCATDEGDWLSLNMSFQRFDQTRENAVAQGKSEVFWEDRWKRQQRSLLAPQKCNQHSESRPPVVPRIVPPGPVRPLPSVVNNPAPLFSRLHSSRFAYGNNSNLNQQQQQPNPFNSNFNNYRDRPPSPSFAPTTPLKFRPLRFFDRVVAFVPPPLSSSPS
ncbi:hypothetical protein RQP46_002409 [Phenoliferia psychrophenolica]